MYLCIYKCIIVSLTLTQPPDPPNILHIVKILNLKESNKKLTWTLFE